MVNDTTAFCSKLSGDSILVLEAVLMLLLSTFSIFVNCIFLHALSNSTGCTSSNVRALVANANICAIVRSTYLFGRGVYLLICAALGFPAVAMKNSLCAIVEFPYAIASMSMITSFLAIGLERLATTVSKNEKKPLKTKKNFCDNNVTEITVRSAEGTVNDMGPPANADDERADGKTKAAIVFCWLQATIIYAVLIAVKEARREAEDDTVVCYCYFPLLTIFEVAAANNVYFAAQELSILFVYGVVYAKNRRRLYEFTIRSVEHSLKDRYDVWTNIRATRMLGPAAVLHACVFTLYLIVNIPAVGNFMAEGTTDSLKILVALNFGTVTDLIAHPILCVRFNERYRTVLGEKWPRLFWIFGGYRSRKRVSPEENAHAPVSSVQGAVVKFKTALEAMSSKDRVAGKKTIVDFRLQPDSHDVILRDMWQKCAK